MTMIETMVAMAISSVLILGAISVYNNARSNYRTAENLARLQESLRFATDTMDQDIRLAGFWGRTNEAARLQVNAGVRILCDANDVTLWAIGSNAVLSRDIAVDADDDNYNLPCPGNNPRGNSDVLVIRRVDTDPTTVPTPNRVQALSGSVGGRIFANGPADVPLASVDPDRQQVSDVIVNAYYVSNRSKYDSNLPSLRRRSLVGETMQDQEIIAGVENLQVQFGIDRDRDGRLDGYVDGDHAAKRDDNIVAVRLWLLVRGDADETAQGYRDTNVYTTPDADGFTVVPTPGPLGLYPDNHRRFAFTKTIMLKNAKRTDNI